nr:hypothetical protein [Atlantibacter hermannii]
MKDMTHEQLIRATYVAAKYENPKTAQLLTELAGRLNCALIAARTACAERATAMKAEIEWETAMRQATGADSVDDVVSVIDQLKSDLTAMASENLTLKESTKNGVIEPHQMTSRGVSVGVKNVIVNREIKTPATDAFLAEVLASAIPEGCAIVPQQIFLDPSDIESICSQCGDGNESGYGDFTDGLLWVGNIQRDDGSIVHGLHISSADYSEEGGVTVCEFAAQLRGNSNGGAL